LFNDRVKTHHARDRRIGGFTDAKLSQSRTCKVDATEQHIPQVLRRIGEKIDLLESPSLCKLV
jgi:hypothetical protein